MREPSTSGYGVVKKGQNSLSREIWLKKFSLRWLECFACNCGLEIRMLTIWRVHMIRITKKITQKHQDLVLVLEQSIQDSVDGIKIQTMLQFFF